MLRISKMYGFALPSAIFLLVILSALSIAILAVNTYSQKTTINDALETKAYFAAKTGVEYGVYRALKNGSCSLTPQTISFSETHLNDFKTTFTCSETVVNEAGIEQTYFKITAFGCNTTGIDCPDGAGHPTTENYVEKYLMMIVAKN